MSDKTEWLADLKVGDPVLIHSTHSGEATDRLAAVKQLTPRQIVTDGNFRFRQQTGQAVGSDIYHNRWLEQPTSEIQATIRQEVLASLFRCGISWDRLPLVTLEAVAELVVKGWKAKR